MGRPKLWQDWNARIIYVKSLLDWHGFIVVEWQRNSVIQIWIRTKANSVVGFHVRRFIIISKIKSYKINKRTIQILRKHVLGYFLTHQPTLCVLLVSKNGQFLNPSSQSSAYVIFEWSLMIELEEWNVLNCNKKSRQF